MPPKHGADLDLGERFAGAKEDRHRHPTLDVIDVHRERAPCVVMHVGLQQPLVAVYRFAGVVDIQNDRRWRDREERQKMSTMTADRWATSMQNGPLSSRLMLGSEQRFRPISGAWRIASFNSESSRSASQSSMFSWPQAIANMRKRSIVGSV